MKTKIQTIIFVFALILTTSNALAQIQSAQTGEWTDTTTWSGGVLPTATDDVNINAAHTISVSNVNAVAHSITFGGDDALIDMNAGARLTVYGDFTIFGDDHTAFSAGWSGTDAKIVFAGSEDQILANFKITGGSTSFRDVVVDKSGGVLKTEGTNMKLGIQNSLHIINGEFLLNDDDDLEGRWASNGNFTNNNLPDVIIEANGSFDMGNDGWHLIRSHHVDPTAIGKFTVHGSARFTRASSSFIRVNDIDIENGGEASFSVNLYSSTNGVKFFPGAVTVKNGAKLNIFTTSDIWDSTTSVDLQTGGTFRTNVSSTEFPANFTNNGTVLYNRTNTSSQQVITDMDYNIIRFAEDNGFEKLWTLASNRSVNELVVEVTATLALEGSATLSVANSVTHDTGIIDAIGTVVVDLGSNGTISETEPYYTMGEVHVNRTLSSGTNEDFGSIGFEVNAAGAAPGTVSIERYAPETIDPDAISRYYEVTPATNSGLDATVVFHYFESELNGLDEANLILYSNDGPGWLEVPGAVVDASANTVTATGVNELSKYTLGTADLAMGISNYELYGIDVTVAPNPIVDSSKLYINSVQASTINLQVFDILGKTVSADILNVNSGINTFNFDVSELNSGIYILKLEMGDATISKRIVLQ